MNWNKKKKTINLDAYKIVTATIHGVLNELELKYLTKNSMEVRVDVNGLKD